MTSSRSTRLLESLQKIYQRPTRPEEWKFDGNLPWNDPEFGARMLQEHLDDTHGAASRVARERAQQIEWIWNRLELQAGSRVFDITCGPGLYGVEFARLGATVSGVDFAPTSIRYAQELARREGLLISATSSNRTFGISTCQRSTSTRPFCSTDSSVFSRNRSRRLSSKRSFAS